MGSPAGGAPQARRLVVSQTQPLGSAARPALRPEEAPACAGTAPGAAAGPDPEAAWAPPPLAGTPAPGDSVGTACAARPSVVTWRPLVVAQRGCRLPAPRAGVGGVELQRPRDRGRAGCHPGEGDPGSGLTGACSPHRDTDGAGGPEGPLWTAWGGPGAPRPRDTGLRGHSLRGPALCSGDSRPPGPRGVLVLPGDTPPHTPREWAAG